MDRPAVNAPNSSSGGGKWLGCLRRAGDARLRLICLPPGGAGPSSFWPWSAHLGGDIELWAACFPGRERRNAELPVTEGDVAVEAIAAELAQLRDLSFVLCGHSLGAGLAYQVTDHLSRHNEVLPRLLILSGRMPPHFPCNARWMDKSDDELAAHLISLGGIPADLARDRSFASVYLPRIRADLKVNETLRYQAMPPVDAPITIINGHEDTLVERQGLLEWRRYTNGEFEAHTVNGNHFFIYDRLPELMSLISARLERLHHVNRSPV
jgi:surfactin synthase thioesterase subunit